MSEEDTAPSSIDFNTFVLSLSTSALMHLGVLPGAEDDATVNLAHAKQSIDCIAIDRSTQRTRCVNIHV